MQFFFFLLTIAISFINMFFVFYPHPLLLFLSFLFLLHVLAREITINLARGITIIFAPSTNNPRPKAQGNRNESWVIRLAGGRKKESWERKRWGRGRGRFSSPPPLTSSCSISLGLLTPPPLKSLLLSATFHYEVLRIQKVGV